MSKAYICDRCGKVQPMPAESLWMVDPSIVGNDDRFRIDLCDECYTEFKREYLKNFQMEGGVS